MVTGKGGQFVERMARRLIDTGRTGVRPRGSMCRLR